MKKLLSYISFLNFILTHPLNRETKMNTLLRILWWKINQKLFNFPVIVELVKDVKCICFPKDSHYSTLVMYQRFPEYGEMSFLLDNLKEGDILIDVGANIGVFSLLASSKIKRGKVYAFEPSSKILPKLYANIALNQKADRIEVIEKAIADKSELINFDLSGYPDYNHILFDSNKFKSSKKNILTIEAITLDKFIKERGLKKIKMIKIDVEGAEMLVLRGLKQSLKEKRIE